MRSYVDGAITRTGQQRGRRSYPDGGPTRTGQSFAGEFGAVRTPRPTLLGGSRCLLGRMAFEGSERLRAHVMFDAFGVHFGDAFRDAKAAEESDDNFMATFASGGKGSSFFGEKNRAIWLSGDKACVLEPGYGAIDGDVSHAEAFGEINDTGFAHFCHKIGDGFDVILGNLVRMFAACLREVLGLTPVAG